MIFCKGLDQFLVGLHVACHLPHFFLRHVVAFDFENSRLGFAIEEAGRPWGGQKV